MTTSNKTTIATQGQNNAITVQRQMADELSYARQGTYSPDYLTGAREATLAAYFVRNPDVLTGHTEALAEMWAAANEPDQAESLINQDEANTATREDVKQWLADSGYAVKNAAMGQYTKAIGERMMLVTAAKLMLSALVVDSGKLGSAKFNPGSKDFHDALIPMENGALQPAMGYAAGLEAIKGFIGGREGLGGAFSRDKSRVMPENLFATNGLPSRGRELMQSKAEELAELLRAENFDVGVEHSGSIVGPSSYLRVYDPETARFFTRQIRLSGHSKGAYNSQAVWNVTDEQFPDVVQAAKQMRELGPAPALNAFSEYEARALKIRVRSGMKKLAKGKPLTKSEQEAIDQLNDQSAPVSGDAESLPPCDVDEGTEIEDSPRP